MAVIRRTDIIQLPLILNTQQGRQKNISVREITIAIFVQDHRDVGGRLFAGSQVFLVHFVHSRKQVGNLRVGVHAAQQFHVPHAETVREGIGKISQQQAASLFEVTGVVQRV